MLRTLYGYDAITEADEEGIERVTGIKRGAYEYTVLKRGRDGASWNPHTGMTMNSLRTGYLRGNYRLVRANRCD